MRGDAVPAHSHTWVWAVLAPEHRRVCVLDDPGLSALLRDAGLDVRERLADRAATCDAVLLRAGAGPPAIHRAAAAVDPAGVVAVALGGGPATLPDRRLPWLRAMQLAASPLQAAGAAVGAARTARMLGAAGLTVQRIGTGERARRYGLGPRGWRWRGRPPVGWVLVGSHGRRPPSIARRSVLEASERLGVALSWSVAGVLESGKLLIELADPAGRPYVLRIAAGHSRDQLEAALRRLAALREADLPGAVRERVAWPLLDGEVGAACYALEPKAAGSHPETMTPELWDDCFRFLVGLHRLGPYAPQADAGGLAAVAAQARVVARHLDGRGRAVLERLERALADRLAALPLGWAHGDFTADNLLVEGAHLRHVLDWDWAAPNALPLVDLLDLSAQWHPATRRMPPGPRLTQVLLPLARAGGDDRMRRYCAATGTPADARTLEGLVVAQWLKRVARDLWPQGDFSRGAAWRAENVSEPLATLERSLL